MAYLGKNDFSEKGRVALIALFTLGAMFLTSFAIGQLGLWGIWRWIHAQPFEVGLIAMMALWGSVMLLLARGVQIATFAVRLVLFAVPLGAWALVILAVYIVRFPYALAALILGPALAPLELWALALWDQITAPPLRLFRGLQRGVLAAWERIAAPVARIVRSLSKEFRLFRTWRDEFSDRFPRYRDFRREFEKTGGSDAGGAGGGKPGVLADPFAEACETLDLPKDGRFTEDEFKARYRGLMKTLHPDVAGPNARAANVTAAVRQIKRRKGWV